MQCTVCGQSYGLTHNCPGIAPAVDAEELAPPPLLRFAPVHYFLQGVKIACWDDGAIRRASRDNNALLYGWIFWAIGNAIILVQAFVQQALAGRDVHWGVVTVIIVVLLLLFALVELGRVGVCHLLARWLCHATGTYLGVLRALLLGSVLTWLFAIPYVGWPAGSIGMVAVLMLVFEEIDGIKRSQAFGIAFGVGLVIQVALYLLLHRG